MLSRRRITACSLLRITRAESRRVSMPAILREEEEEEEEEELRPF
jgi:hypothetical protein